MGDYTTLLLGRYELQIDLTGNGVVVAFDNVRAENCIGTFFFFFFVTLVDPYVPGTYYNYCNRGPLFHLQCTDLFLSSENSNNSFSLLLFTFP